MSQHPAPAYGPTWWYPIAIDPQQPDELEWHELSDAEKRARLTELTHKQLVDQAMQFADDAEMWEGIAQQMKKEQA